MSGASAINPSNLPLGETFDATFVEKAMAQGMERVEIHKDSTAPRSAVTNGLFTRYRLVKQTNASAQSKNTNQKWDPGAWGVATDGVGGATDHVAGIVDQYLGSSTVAQNRYYWLAIHGVHPCTTSASYSEGVTLAPAASGKTAASSSPPNAYDFAFAMEAATAGDETKDVWLKCTGS